MSLNFLDEFYPVPDLEAVILCLRQMHSPAEMSALKADLSWWWENATLQAPLSPRKGLVKSGALT